MPTYVGKMKVDGTNELPIASTLYGTCSTAAATAAKVVTCANFDQLITGVTIHVKFTYSNTVANPTLNVNSTGAKNIYRYGTTAPSTAASSSWNAGAVISFTYDGSYWQMNDWLNTDSNTDTNVTQTATTTSADYEVLFSSTADNTTRTEGARKNSNLKFNPSTGNLQATKINGASVPELFYATINTTSYADLLAAIQANKMIILQNGSGLYMPCTSEVDYSSLMDMIILNGVFPENSNGLKIYKYTITDDDTWNEVVETTQSIFIGQLGTAPCSDLINAVKAGKSVFIRTGNSRTLMGTSLMYSADETYCTLVVWGVDSTDSRFIKATKYRVSSENGWETLSGGYFSFTDMMFARLYSVTLTNDQTSIDLRTSLSMPGTVVSITIPSANTNALNIYPPTITGANTIVTFKANNASLTFKNTNTSRKYSDGNTVTATNADFTYTDLVVGHRYEFDLFELGSMVTITRQDWGAE